VDEQNEVSDEMPAAAAPDVPTQADDEAQRAAQEAASAALRAQQV
jgi:hypothetical protein